MRKTLVALAVLTLLSGCEDRFRYTCQDPKNWELDSCKPPVCEVTGTCTYQLIKPKEHK